MIPAASWIDLVPPHTRTDTRLRNEHVDGNVPQFELDVTDRLVASHDPGTLFEIGTFDGRTTRNQAAHSRPDAPVDRQDLFLQLPGPNSLIELRRAGERAEVRRPDSEQPEYLPASRRLEMARASVPEGVPLTAKVSAANIGDAAWLPEGWIGDRADNRRSRVLRNHA